MHLKRPFNRTTKDLEGLRGKALYVTVDDVRNLTDTEKHAILSNRAAADPPQPLDYGLTYYDLHNTHPNPSTKHDDGLRYKEPEQSKTAVWEVFPLNVVLYVLWYLLCMLAAPLLILWAVLYSSFHRVPDCEQRDLSEEQFAGLSAYYRALRLHRLYKVLKNEEEQALLRQKRSYWERLNGYEFEKATAEVLKRHQFNPQVTPGSGDGGVDIEVSRAGQKGVVQCKAHAACVGPAPVRELFGVMHDSGCDFGMVVSLGGFTKGAVSFAGDKRMFLVDVSHLIAMQEGQDVLAERFTRTDN